jgi:hypothetical protein
VRKSRISMTIRGDNPSGERDFPLHGQRKAALLYPAGHPGRHNLFYPVLTFLQPYGVFPFIPFRNPVFPGLFPVVTGLVLSDAKFGSPA